MKTYVITGGTDGIGKALALRCLGRGDEVVVVGRDAEKGAAWLAVATPAVQAQVDAIRRTAQTVEDAVRPLAALLDAPPEAPLSAFVQGVPFGLDGAGDELAAARRLRRGTERLLAGA